MHYIVYNPAPIYHPRGPSFHKYFRPKFYVVMKSTDFYLRVSGYSPTNNLTDLKWRRVIWTGYVGRTGKVQKCVNFIPGILEVRDYIGNQNEYGTIILKSILEHGSRSN
jgi:hypothetical protein